MAPSTRSRALAAAAVAACLVALAPTGAAADDDSVLSYGLVIDAGSSGSRLHIFKWPKRRFDASKLPARDLSVPVELDSASKCTPGIDKPEGVTKLAALVASAKAMPIFADGVASQTPVFLKATAGMRIATPEVRARQLASVRDMLRKSGFLFTSDSQARVISGEEEGVFGWLSVNYAKGALHYAAPNTLTGTYGALDLGGASTQITIKPALPDILSDSFTVRLGAVLAEDLYTHSFLYFGQNELTTRVNQALLYQNWPAAPAGQAPSTVPSPCLYAGLNQSFTDPATGASTTLVGYGDMDACRNGPLASLINKRAVCLTVPRPRLDSLAAPAPPAPAGPAQHGRALRALPSPAPAINATASGCSIQGVYQPPLTGLRLVAFSGFTYVWNLLDMPGEGGTLAAFEPRVRDLCALSWAQVQQQYGSVAPPAFLATYCLGGAATLSLLVDGYGMDPTDPQALIVAESADTYGWALGSILYEANVAGYDVLLPYEALFIAAVAVAGVAGCAVVCLLGLLCGCCGCVAARCCCGGGRSGWGDGPRAKGTKASLNAADLDVVVESPLA